MIRLTTDDAEVECSASVSRSQRWHVVHPGGEVLAYCDTKKEAVQVREAFNDLARQLRAIGSVVE